MEKKADAMGQPEGRHGCHKQPAVHEISDSDGGHKMDTSRQEFEEQLEEFLVSEEEEREEEDWLADLANQY